MCYSKLDCFSNSLSNFPITRVENAAKVVIFYFTGKYISLILFFFNIGGRLKGIKQKKDRNEWIGL